MRGPLPIFSVPLGHGWRTAVILAALPLLLSRSAGAKEVARIPVGFAYHAEPSCMSEGAAFSLVNRRSSRVTRVPPSEAKQILQMEVAFRGEGYRGKLVVQREGQAPEQRTMTGENCDEVVEALALTAALSIDPHATLTLGPVDEDREATGLLRPEEAQEDSTGAGSEEPVEEGAIEFSLGVEGAAEKLLTHAVHGNAGLVFGASRPGRRWWFPLELSLSVLGTSVLGQAPQEGVTTQRVAARLSYCPLRFGQRLSLLICPLGDFGALFAQSRGFESETNAARFTALVGGEARLRARVGRRGQLWLAPSFATPLTERQFAVDPGPEILTSTVSVGWRAASGIAWVF